MISSLGVVEALCTVALLVTGIWYYFVANYGFWRQRGVPGPEPQIFFGNFKDIMLGRVSFAESLKQMCDQFHDAPIVGVYLRRMPLLLLRDPELIQDVLIKDFASFSDRGNPIHEDVEPLSAHLFNLETERWRPLRPKLSPAFTSGKLKHMFALILECAEHFETYLDGLVEKGEPIDCREITAKFTTDVIGSCAFGLQMNSIADEDSEFRKMGRKIFIFDLKARILTTMRSATPWLYKLLGIPALRKEAADFFMSSMKQTMEHRRKNNVRRGDLVDMLIEIQDSPDKLDFELTDALITAQAYVFFLAGFETSSSTISHALLELAQRQDVQDKLRREIIESLEANNGNVSYDSIKQMKYLNIPHSMKETLRLRPPLVFHMRKATKDYTFRDVNLSISKGQRLWIPIWDIHQNPDYYPNPEYFDPERFSEDNFKVRHPMTYLPFGGGPRNCIGARFAVNQTKLGLIKILAKYKVEVCEKTCLPFKPDCKSFVLASMGGVHLKFSKLK